MVPAVGTDDLECAAWRDARPIEQVKRTADLAREVHSLGEVQTERTAERHRDARSKEIVESQASASKIIWSIPPVSITNCLFDVDRDGWSGGIGGRIAVIIADDQVCPAPNSNPMTWPSTRIEFLSVAPRIATP